MISATLFQYQKKNGQLLLELPVFTLHSTMVPRKSSNILDPIHYFSSLCLPDEHGGRIKRQRGIGINTTNTFKNPQINGRILGRNHQNHFKKIINIMTGSRHTNRAFTLVLRVSGCSEPDHLQAMPYHEFLKLLKGRMSPFLEIIS